MYDFLIFIMNTFIVHKIMLVTTENTANLIIITMNIVLFSCKYKFKLNNIKDKSFSSLICMLIKVDH